MSRYYGAGITPADIENRFELAKRGLNPEGWNVRLNGEDIAVCVTREEAGEYMAAWRVKPCGPIAIYRADRPLDQRPAAWHKAPLPKPQSLRCSAAERAKLLAKLAADGTLKTIEEPQTLAA